MKFNSEILARDHKLAESPGWSENDSAYHWVDIETSQLFFSRDGELSCTEIQSGITSVQSTGNRTFLGTGRNSLLRIHNDRLETLWAAEGDVSGWRFNDSYFAGKGRLIVGTKSTTEEHHGQKLGIWDGRNLVWKFNGMTLANGMVLHREANFFFVADSISKRILRWPLGADELPDFAQKPHVFLTGFAGEPDGLALDQFGNLWVALWGVGQIKCFDLDGEELYSLKVEAKFVTSIDWVGASKQHLLITTAEGGGTTHPDSHFECKGGDVVLVKDFEPFG